MIETFIRRIEQLKNDRKAYEEKLGQLEEQRVEISNALQRVNGAIEVLEEEIERLKQPSDEATQE